MKPINLYNGTLIDTPGQNSYVYLYSDAEETSDSYTISQLNDSQSAKKSRKRRHDSTEGKQIAKFNSYNINNLSKKNNFVSDEPLPPRNFKVEPLK